MIALIYRKLKKKMRIICSAEKLTRVNINLQLNLETPFAFIIERSLREILGGISIYNINPLLSKKATPITGKAELEEDGENLAIVLKNIIEDKNKAWN